MEVLDLFSAAAGGWSLGMHRAGFKTIAACENVAWRRAIYQENNPDVLIYDDVCTLTADRIIRDTGRFPPIVVGSPPCQDISPANTKGKGVEGERSGLYFEAIRIIGEGRPRWFALENSSNLRTRGADAVLAALEALGYTCWTFVVRAGDIGANHERPRSWIIGCDLSQVSHADGHGQYAPSFNEQMGKLHTLAHSAGYTQEDGCRSGLSGRRARATAGSEQSPRGHAFNAEGIGHEGGRPWGYGPDGHGAASVAGSITGNASDADQADGCMVPCVRQAEIANDGRGSGWSDDRQGFGQMAVREGGRFDPATWRADWSLNDLADHIRMDDGLSSWLAGTRIAVGGPRGTSAASLIVEAFGDAVVPQIPEAIGKAILRTERALAAIYERTSA
ncbi:DNA cytosine methyltransferase [Agrobacterium pusense]|uniref:DNA cytosine methyltransferase n=1 Tax=Agrobacterium pusense TaxID=648995 RepID=UPI00244BD120|nr:DNA cytosine methyltransferase [Agrobacterium pusense]MDH0869735.1 DNA cytosine methyltransferase [Agrobacterium pusense]